MGMLFIGISLWSHGANVPLQSATATSSPAAAGNSVLSVNRFGNGITSDLLQDHAEPATRMIIADDYDDSNVLCCFEPSECRMMYTNQNILGGKRTVTIDAQGSAGGPNCVEIEEYVFRINQGIRVRSNVSIVYQPLLEGETVCFSNWKSLWFLGALTSEEAQFNVTIEGVGGNVYSNTVICPPGGLYDMPLINRGQAPVQAWKQILIQFVAESYGNDFMLDALGIEEYVNIESPRITNVSRGEHFSKVQIQWTGVLEAAGYELWRSDKPSPDTAIKIYDGELLKYEDADVDQCVFYWYWVKAKNAPLESEFSEGQLGYAGEPIPAKPVNMYATDGLFTNRVELSWIRVTNATRYEVWKNAVDDTNGAVKIGEVGEPTMVDTNVHENVINWYWVAPGGLCGTGEWSNSDSGYAGTTITGIVAIIMHPQSVTVVEGASAEFTVEASGTEPLGYQWMKDGAPIAGATGSTYRIDSVHRSAEGKYRVAVTNQFSHAESQDAQLTVLVPPVIRVGPTNQVVALGGEARFAVVAEGTQPLVYQWYKNGVQMAGKTNADLRIGPVTERDVGAYGVRVSNEANLPVYAEADLAVLPVIIIPPVPRTNVAGSSLMMRVVGSGQEPLRYQWIKDGGVITGATNRLHVIGNVDVGQAGDYRVVLGDRYGTVTSEVARLTVRLAEPPGVLAGPITNADNQRRYYLLESSTWVEAEAAAQAMGGHLATIRDAAEQAWIYGVFGQYGGSNRNLCIGLVDEDPEHNATNRLERIGEFKWVSGEPMSYTNWYSDEPNNYEELGEYYVHIFSPNFVTWGGYWNDAWDTDYNQVAPLHGVVELGMGPVIVRCPESQRVVEGASAEFTVEASGTEPLGYQWMKDGAPIAGATGSTYRIDSVHRSAEGKYRVAVTNQFSHAESQDAQLTVLVPPVIRVGPTNQVVALGGEARFAVVAEGTQPLVYQWYKNGVQMAGKTNADLRIGPVTERDVGAYGVRVSNEANLPVYAEADLAVLPVIIIPPVPRTNVAGSSLMMRVVGSGQEPLRYQWIKDGGVITGATNRLHVIGNVDVGQAGDYRVVLGDRYGTVTSEVARLTVRLAEPPGVLAGPITNADNQRRYYLLESSTWVEAEAAAQAMGGHLATIRDAAEQAWIYGVFGQYGGSNRNLCIGLVDEDPEHNATNRLERIGEFKWVSGEPMSYTNWYSDEPNNYEELGEYYVHIFSPNFVTWGGYWNDAWDTDYNQVAPLHGVVELGMGPVIVRCPESQRVVEGASAEFTVEASGTEPLSYQWMKESKPIAGTTNATYRIGAVAWEHYGTYQVAVTNQFGSNRCEGIKLYVVFKPQITAPPKIQTVVAGSSAVFTVVATGTEPLSYQWHKDGLAIPGATDSSYRMAPVQWSDAGIYRVVVTNEAGEATSNPATLTVRDSEPGAVSDLPACYTNGQPLWIEIRVTPPESAMFYAVRDQLPTGWVASQITADGALNDGKVRWVFADGMPRLLGYLATPPAGAGTAAFSGIAGFDGLNEMPVGGDRQMAVCVDERAPRLGLRVVKLIDERYAVLEVSGKTGTTYEIQATSSLDPQTTWENVGALTLEGEKTDWFDLDPLDDQPRFYRAVLVGE